MVYRVLEQITVPGESNRSDPRVLWEGSNIRELCQRYPRSSDTRMDDLRNFSCGDFDKWISFEVMRGNQWETCDDPRPIEPARRKSRW